MSRQALLVLAVLVTSFGSGCGRPSVQAASTPRSGAVPTPAPAEEARSFCLADPAGSDAVDKSLRSAQGSVRGMSDVRPEAWVSIGRTWLRKARSASDPGFYVSVEACSRLALAAQDAYPPALELRGLALMNDHRFEEARRLADAIVERDPDNHIAFGLLSDALLELGRYAEALAAAERQMNARPDMSAFARSSYLAWINGDAKRAKLLIREALISRDARDPEPAAWTFVEAANIFWQQADYDGADAVYAEALKWVPDYPAALVGRARVALARKRPESAIPLLERAYRQRPLVEMAWLLGDAKAMKGDSAGAERAWDEAVLQGRRGDKLTLAAFFATKDRAADEAVRLVEAERKTRGGVYVDDAYAWALYRTGRLDEARSMSDRAIRLGTRDARLLYHAGAIRLAAGDASGRKLIEQALALHPNFEPTGAQEARALLDRAAPRTASR